jgi:hypothetical protein
MNCYKISEKKINKDTLLVGNEFQRGLCSLTSFGLYFFKRRPKRRG